MPNIGPVEVIVFGVVVLIVAAIAASLISGPKAAVGQRLLQRWGVREATVEQGAVAAVYLRTRRRRYLPVFVLLWGAVGFVRAAADVPGDTSWVLLLLGTIIASLLISEVWAILRPALRSERSAALVRRGVTDLVPAYGVLAFGSVTLVALFAVMLNLFLPGAGKGSIWLLLLSSAATASACAGVVWLCLVRGPLYDDGLVDAALRIRTARVTIGAGLLLMWWIAAAAFDRVDNLVHAKADAGLPPLLAFAEAVRSPAVTFVFVMSLFAWGMLVNPWRKQRLVEANR